MPPVRPVPLLAVAGLLLALTAPGATAAAAPAAASAATVPDAVQMVTELQQRVDELAAQLSDGTRAYEDGQARLGQAQAGVVAAERAAEQAAGTSAQTADAVREAVRVRYRNPTPQGLQVLLELHGGQLSDALAVRTALARAQAQAEQSHDLATAVTQQSADASTRAEQLREQVAGLSDDQAERLRSLQDLATRAQVELEATSERLRELQAAQRRARARAAAAAARAEAAEQAAAREAATRAEAQRLADAATTTGSTGTGSTGTGSTGTGSTGTGSGCTSTTPVTAPNGLLPDSALCALETAPGHRLVPAAARAFDALSRAHLAETGAPLCITDSYRTYREQVRLFGVKPTLAAVPGTSNHGWGRAVDLCGGIESFGTAEHRWMQANAPRFGWVHPAWAEPSGSRPEPWHWEHPGQ